MIEVPIPLGMFSGRSQGSQYSLELFGGAFLLYLKGVRLLNRLLLEFKGLYKESAKVYQQPSRRGSPCTFGAIKTTSVDDQRSLIIDKTVTVSVPDVPAPIKEEISEKWS